VGQPVKITGYFNEYGELRAVPGKTNTVPLRIFTKAIPGDPAHTVNMFEVMDDRNTRTLLMGVDSLGNITAPNIGAKVLVLAAGAPVPGGTPAGTVIIRLP
jgi:hypothetical protein